MPLFPLWIAKVSVLDVKREEEEAEDVEKETSFRARYSPLGLVLFPA